MNTHGTFSLDHTLNFQHTGAGEKHWFQPHSESKAGMGAHTHVLSMMARKNAQRASWDNEKDAFLVDAMLEQTLAGERADPGWKKEAWRTATTVLNGCFAVSYDYR